MSENKAIPKINNLGDCFRLVGDSVLFSVTDFVRATKLPDDPRLRQAVIEELRDMFPNVRIMEEEN